jgi:hypothetical protein
MHKSVVKQLDHVIARTSHADALFEIFSETFRLPVAWPVTSNKAFTSGGINLGNLYLEILKVGAADDARAQEGARLCAIAFECDGTEEAVKELNRRGLKCSAVVPFIDSPDGRADKHLWSNAFLDGLVGTDFWTKYVIFCTKMPGYMFWADLLRGSRVERAGMSRLFSGALVCLVEYEYQNFIDMPRWSDFESHEEKRAADARTLTERGGGPLGLVSVKEIVASVKDYGRAAENWGKLCAPAEALESGLWGIADGPSVRLLRGPSDCLQALVLRVSDLTRAETFLREKDMLGSVSENQIQIDPMKIQGLQIRLV